MSEYSKLGWSSIGQMKMALLMPSPALLLVGYLYWNSTFKVIQDGPAAMIFIVLAALAMACSMYMSSIVGWFHYKKLIHEKGIDEANRIRKTISETDYGQTPNFE